jgi:hypothetical protein
MIDRTGATAATLSRLAANIASFFRARTDMKQWAGMAALMLLTGCMGMSQTRSAGPVQVYSSQKPAAVVAECVKVSWANVQIFGDVADTFMKTNAPGDFTVYTTEGDYFADIVGKGPTTSISFYAKPKAPTKDQRGAVVATCL